MYWVVAFTRLFSASLRELLTNGVQCGNLPFNTCMKMRNTLAKAKLIKKVSYLAEKMTPS